VEVWLHEVRPTILPDPLWLTQQEKRSKNIQFVWLHIATAVELSSLSFLSTSLFPASVTACCLVHSILLFLEAPFI
jgi:hypothetical protein